MTSICDRHGRIARDQVARRIEHRSRDERQKAAGGMATSCSPTPLHFVLVTLGSIFVLLVILVRSVVKLPFHKRADGRS